MADREVHHYNEGGSSGAMGFIGIILGALLVVGGIFFIVSNMDGMDGSDTRVTINTPSAPSAPAAPSAPSAPSTTGSGATK